MTKTNLDFLIDALNQAFEQQEIEFKVEKSTIDNQYNLLRHNNLISDSKCLKTGNIDSLYHYTNGLYDMYSILTF